MDNNLKYRRNWAYEQHATVYFVDGSEYECFCRTDNKGKIEYIIYNDEQYTPDQFGELGVADVHFMTPACLEVKSPTYILAQAYLRLGKEICKGDNIETRRRLTRRECIADEIRSRGINLHDAMAEVSE